ncbi:hypothetical protein OAU50_01035 [Planctomycetota bacterium]|nr:hypothetical protein [Planctomycetota bacterium]
MRTLFAIVACLFAFSACSTSPDNGILDDNQNVVVHDLESVADVKQEHFDDAILAGEHEVIVIVINMAEKRKESVLTLTVTDEEGIRTPVTQGHIFRKHLSIREYIDASSVQEHGVGLLAAVRITGDSAKINVVEESSKHSGILGFAGHATSKVSNQRSVVLVLLNDDSVEIRAYE